MGVNRLEDGYVARPAGTHAEARAEMRRWLLSDEPRVSLDLSGLTADEAWDIAGRLEAADRWLRERGAKP